MNDTATETEIDLKKKRKKTLPLRGGICRNSSTRNHKKTSKSKENQRLANNKSVRGTQNRGGGEQEEAEEEED